MSRSVRGSKGCGYDYWGKRAMSQCSPGRENKKLTLGIERMKEAVKGPFIEIPKGLSHKDRQEYVRTKLRELEK